MEAMENWQEDEAPPLLEDEIEVFEGEDERDDPSTLPLGFKFCPSDEEIITNYLIPKVRRMPLACEWVVVDIELYKFSPMGLTEMYADRGHDGIWYFFTPRNRKYEKGNRPDRAAFEGYWQAISGDIEIKDMKTKLKIGAKKSLVFNKTKDRKLDPGTKTQWMMVEYKIEESRKAFGTWMLDDYVFCKIYQARRSKKAAAKAKKLRQVQPLNEKSGPEAEPEQSSVPSQSKQTEPNLCPCPPSTSYASSELLESQTKQTELNQIPCPPSTSYASCELLESQKEQTELNQIPCPPSTSYASSELFESQTEKTEPNQIPCPPSTSYANSDMHETTFQSELHRILHPRPSHNLTGQLEPYNADHCPDSFTELEIPDLPLIYGPEGDFNFTFPPTEQFNSTGYGPQYTVLQEPFGLANCNMYGYGHGYYPYNTPISYSENLQQNNYDMDQIPTHTHYNYVCNNFQPGPANYNFAPVQPSMPNYCTTSRFQPNSATITNINRREQSQGSLNQAAAMELMQSQKRN